MTGIRSMLVSPLAYKGNHVGVLKVMSKKPYQFSHTEEILLDLVNDTLSAAMYLAAKMDSNELLYHATHDSMTQLANRGLFMERLRASMHQYKPGKEDIWVMLLDMDGLKVLNDTYGHHIGDQAIKVMAERIKNNSKIKDTVARLGGDEFAVLKETSPNIKIELLIKRLKRVLELPFEYQHHTYPLGASIGAANYPKDSTEADGLLMFADNQMYEAKRARKEVVSAIVAVHH
ncbi:MAG TPA: sensor domain-containing diguanylate cyclase [Methylophilus sp.]